MITAFIVLLALVCCNAEEGNAGAGSLVVGVVACVLFNWLG